MPKRAEFGPNEAAWRAFSAKSLAIAMTWPEEKLFRFTQHHKFANLTADDQAVILKKLEAKVAQPSAVGSAVRRPAPPPSTRPKPRRVPAELALATEPASAPRRAFIDGELRAATARSTTYWVMVIVIGTIVLKLFTAG